jgi:hypothetical protein
MIFVGQPAKRQRMDTNKRFEMELIGNCFSKETFVLVQRTNHAGVIVKETFASNKFPCFLTGLMKTDPEMYAQFLQNAVIFTLVSDQK